MTATTIKLSSTLRDQLKEQAQSHGRTLGQHLQALADDQARRDRFAALARAMADNPPDAVYAAQAAEWQSDAWN